jgi:hypothetical protein
MPELNREGALGVRIGSRFSIFGNLVAEFSLSHEGNNVMPRKECYEENL